MTVKQLRRWLRTQPNDATVRAVATSEGAIPGAAVELEEDWWSGEARSEPILLYVERRRPCASCG